MRSNKSGDVVQVPDIEKPNRYLCWKQAPDMTRCDRAQGHLGMHSWESHGVITALMLQLREAQIKSKEYIPL